MPFIDKKPSIENLTSQIVTYKQTCENGYQDLIDEMKEINLHNRKQWEYVFILKALKDKGMLSEGRKGIGFGVGSEPMPAVMAKYGVNVLATEINIEKKNDNGWVKGRNKEQQLNMLNSRGICDAGKFKELVRYRDVDMNKIPDDLHDFDFTWSSCALEHLGTMEKCTDFIFNSLKTLKPGGVAVHTTEFTLSKNSTVTEGSTVFFREKDIREIEKRLTDQGHKITINLNKGKTVKDWMIDLPPYKRKNHIKLLVSKQWKFLVVTSIGLIIQKSEN